MEITEIREKLTTARRKHASKVSTMSRFVKGVLIIGGALVAGVCQFVTWPVGQSPTIADIAGIAASIVVGLGGLFVLFTEQDAAAAVSVAQDALDEADATATAANELQDFFSAFDRLVETYQICLTLRGALERAAGAPSLDSLIESMFDLVARPMAIAAGFEQSDRWTIGIYKAEPAAKANKFQLRCIAHTRAIKCETGAARVWPEGVGIAGIAFANKREIVLPDLRVEGMEAVFGPQDHSREYDSERYVSMVSVPVEVFGRDRPWGVVNATSDRSGHFSAASSPGLKNDESVRTLAAFIGLAVSMWDGLEARRNPPLQP